jgi:hypothetical protein
MIDSFTDKFGFLSNFYPGTIDYDGKLWGSVEHAYQAAKTINETEKDWIRQSPNAAVAKKRGRKATVRSDWEKIKVSVMLDILRIKFSQPPFKRDLLATGKEELVEGNWWGDTFWGVCKGKGQNMLGKLLMQIREELTKKEE